MCLRFWNSKTKRKLTSKFPYPCVECGHKKFREGPSAGAGIMYKCGNCGHHYTRVSGFGMIDRGPALSKEKTQ